MGKGSAPSAPDPYASAAAQYQYGTSAAAFNAGLNQVNQVGPTQSTSYTQTGTSPYGAPEYTATTQLSPNEQALLTGREQLSGEGQQLAGSQGQNAGSAITNWQLPTEGQNQQFGENAMQAAYGLETSTLDPHWNQQQEQLDASLRNSGATPGTPAYDNAMQAFNAQRTAAYGSAENQAFGQGLAAEGQQIQDVNQAQGGQIGNFLSLLTGQQPGSAGGGGGGGGGTGGSGASVSAPNLMQAFENQYQGQLANYNANVSSSNADTGALATILAAIIGTSDERLKKDIEPLHAKTARGNPLYEYRYKFQKKSEPKQVGVMAQEAEKRTPDAVTKDEHGIRYVDYSRA